MFRNCLRIALLAAASTAAAAATFETIKDPTCINSNFVAGLSFSTGEQYNDANGGIIDDRWFMLARWQGANEQDFMSNGVVYDMGNFTGIHGAYQRGVSPENATGSAGVQLNCYYSGMLINTWTVPHRPVVGGGYNDMFGYSFSGPNQVFPFDKNGVATDLVLQSNIAIPGYVTTHNTVDGTGAPYPLVANVGFYAYLKDTSHPSYPPIVVIAATHISNLDAPYLAGGGISFDYSANMTNAAKAAHPYWLSSAPANGYGIWFASAPISSSNNQRYVTKVFSEGDSNTALVPVSDPNAPMPFWRAHITPANLANMVTDINAQASGCAAPACPPTPPGGYSTNRADWSLLYAGVIAEASVVSDMARNSYDVSRTNWGGMPTGPTPYADNTRDQIALVVRTYGTGIYRYIP